MWTLYLLNVKGEVCLCQHLKSLVHWRLCQGISLLLLLYIKKLCSGYKVWFIRWMLASLTDEYWRHVERHPPTWTSYLKWMTLCAQGENVTARNVKGKIQEKTVGAKHCGRMEKRESEIIGDNTSQDNNDDPWHRLTIDWFFIAFCYDDVNTNETTLSLW